MQRTQWMQCMQRNTVAYFISQMTKGMQEKYASKYAMNALLSRIWNVHPFHKFNSAKYTQFYIFSQLYFTEYTFSKFCISQNTCFPSWQSMAQKI